MTIHESREQFGKSAEAYLASAIHAQGDDLAAMVAWADEAMASLEGRGLLDVATGAGHTAVAFAKAGARVTALDLTPEMLDVARRFAAKQLGENTIAFVTGSAESLPFGDRSFDVVTCRIAAHHFGDPQKFVGECYRVLKPNGRFLLVDNIAPEAPELDDAMNRIERLRDPSHVRAYTVRFWVDAVVHAGLSPERLERWERTKEFRDWVERSQTPPAVVAELELLVSNLPESAVRYFSVETDHGDIVRLSHEVMMLSAYKRG